MPYLVFDTETNGKAVFTKPSSDPCQPDLVQLAMLLFDDSHKEIAGTHCIIQPNNWAIPDEAANIHGISTEFAERYGISLQTATELFAEYVSIADTVVAHNIMFDSIIIRKAFYDLYSGSVDPLEGKKTFCTMRSCTGILKLRKPEGGGGYKWPKLKECIKYFFDEDMEGAHHAMVDTIACKRVYQHLLTLNLPVKA